jgi:hypothetical protein
MGVWNKDCCTQIERASGLYNKHTTIVNDDCSIINKFVSSLTDDARVIIYNHNMFIIQADG